ncbi:MAG: alpha/beta hydrolase [Proteobacteria bacterium]|nr:alpha/beta hydrolase [Pseudomonadota bacterium]
MQSPIAYRHAVLNEIEMHYQIRGQGEPLLLLHGFTGSSGDWSHVFDLAELARRYRLIVPDLRGHGRSANPSGTLTHRQCADDVAALLDHLDIDTFKAIGLSFGGNILLHMSTRHPARADAMVLVSSPSYFPDQARQIMRTMTVESRSDEEWQIMRERHVHGDMQIRALWNQARAFADRYDDINFTPAYLSTITARTLLVAGDRDPLYPVGIFVEMYRAMPRSFLWICPGGGHGPIFGAARNSFARTALSFVSDDWTAGPDGVQKRVSEPVSERRVTD